MLAKMALFKLIKMILELDFLVLLVHLFIYLIIINCLPPQKYLIIFLLNPEEISSWIGDEVNVNAF
jgi:hypothetical protein